MHEFDLIRRLQARACGGAGVSLGIGDDAALLQIADGQQLVVTCDTLNAGVHFPDDTAPYDIGWKALAVNLSDLAAMGATPRWCTLSLSLPQSDAAWVDAFADGFFALAHQHSVALVGGDTTRGPLAVSVTAMGVVPAGTALRRDGAQAGDDLWLTGTLGDAAAALAQWRAGSAMHADLRARLDRPQPRLGFGIALRDLAHACIDVSDGLLQDLGHLCSASGVGAEVWLTQLPASPALIATHPADDTRHRLQATGGDDYELCFTASASRRKRIAALHADGTKATRIGRIVSGEAVRALQADGNAWRPPRNGFEHFAD